MWRKVSRGGKVLFIFFSHAHALEKKRKSREGTRGQSWERGNRNQANARTRSSALARARARERERTKNHHRRPSSFDPFSTRKNTRDSKTHKTPSHLDRSLLHKVLLEDPLQVGAREELVGRESIRLEVRVEGLVGRRKEGGRKRRVGQFVGQVRGFHGGEERGEGGGGRGDRGDGRLGYCIFFVFVFFRAGKL